MLFGYFLAYGFGTETDINSSIDFYTRAKDMGEKRAESNMVVSVVKNCYTEKKIDVLRDAYKNGNEMAIKYVDYVVNGWNSNPENSQSIITTEHIWEIDEAELLNVLNGPFFQWVCSNKTYETSQSVISTPTFTRTYLYQIGTDRVYRECVLVTNPNFPDWLQEDIW